MVAECAATLPTRQSPARLLFGFVSHLGGIAVSVRRMLHHVIFDFDGTLADSERLCFELLNDLAAKHGYPGLGQAAWREFKFLTYPERLRRLEVPLMRVPFLAGEARRHYCARMQNLHPFPGVTELLAQLRSLGVSLHVLSSNAAPNIHRFLQRHGLDCFSSVTCERNFFGKHVGLRRFMERRGLTSREVVYVGDELRDIEACRKAGLRIVSAAWGFDPIELLEGANPGLTARAPAGVPGLLRAAFDPAPRAALDLPVAWAAGLAV